jgi:hypothetical protein
MGCKTRHRHWLWLRGMGSGSATLAWIDSPCLDAIPNSWLPYQTRSSSNGKRSVTWASGDISPPGVNPWGVNLAAESIPVDGGRVLCLWALYFSEYTTSGVLRALGWDHRAKNASGIGALTLSSLRHNLRAKRRRGHR